MQTRRLIIVIGSIVAAAIVAWLAASAFWETSGPKPADWAKLVKGVQSFVADTKGRGQPLPASVSMRELGDHHYLTGADVRVFEGMEVTFSLGDDATQPQLARIHVRMADGTQFVLLADGSAQQVAK